MPYSVWVKWFMSVFYEPSCHVTLRTNLSCTRYSLLHADEVIVFFELYNFHIGPWVNTNHLCKHRLLTGLYDERWVPPAWNTLLCFWSGYPANKQTNADAHIIQYLGLTHSSSMRHNWRTSCCVNDQYILPPPFSPVQSLTHKLMLHIRCPLDAL